jgi:translation initiation factor IF-2
MRPRRKKSKKELKAERAQKAETGDQTSDVRPSKSGIQNPISVPLPQVITVRDLAEKFGLPVEKVISELIKNGVMANINQSVDFETAQIIGLELGYRVVGQKTDEDKKGTSSPNLKPRPPVVTVMGHVDHGKTQLLDTIRKTDVVGQESGAITQHIGAYQVEIKYKGKKKQITFLDTPGHEAFSAMRAHGANLTDIVVLVVAADDSVKPQTIEAVSHARSASVPIIVAINKIDLPDADTEKVKKELAEINLLPEEWGGKTPTIEISAKQNKNIDKLLEMILLVAEMEELKADSQTASRGAVIESKISKGFGPVATVLVQEGRLEVGDIITVGKTWAKIKALIDWRGQRIKEALPSTPVRITGLRALPESGEVFIEQKDEKTARQVASQLQKTRVVKSIRQSEAQKGDVRDLTVAKLILKADAAGSLKAIQDKIKEIDDSKIKVEIISQGVGAINETDVNLASATNGLVLSFRTRINREVRRLAQEKKVKILESDIIYELLDSLYQYLEEILPPEIIEESIGKGKIIKIFHQFKTQAIVGIKVIKGRLKSNFDANLIRNETKVGRLKILSLERDKSSTNEVKTGQTAGGKLSKKEPFTKIKIGDIIEAYKIKRKLIKLK